MPVVYVPVAQSAQRRSTDAEGTFVTYLPAAQVDQDGQLASLLASVKLPESQALHVRLTVVEGVLVT
jgi:hypothetical protein